MLFRKKYSYYVSYVYRKDGSTHFDVVFIDIKFKIKTSDDITVLVNELKKYKDTDKLLILGWNTINSK